MQHEIALMPMASVGASVTCAAPASTHHAECELRCQGRDVYMTHMHDMWLQQDDVHNAPACRPVMHERRRL